ncbi:hypothetical protein EV141_1498 [Microcella putealis]|uniref:Uncharacterized protein n=1 Tax=Microcella putealis TaxID=337005 RepID=A0A4Q7LV42_9MICO|nr:hypothetical protein [Microcella putealis]RZS57778.1 hypothetical protein EV141_1498 [Microcella putealis]TQM24845.1 hypothetical protein BJ957_1107 [Microcella putealis]
MTATRLRRHVIAVVCAIVLATAGCAVPADGDAPAADAPAPTPTPTPTPAATLGECGSAPDENTPGDYPAANLPAVEQRTAELVGYFEAVDGRYCIDAAGEITYFLIYDFAEDGFHTLDVCGSVFTYFEGDFEGAAVVYTDATARCG